MIDMKWTLMTYMTCTALPVCNCDGLHCNILHLAIIHHLPALQKKKLERNLKQVKQVCYRLSSERGLC